MIAIRGVVLPLAHHTLEVDAELHARTTALYGPSGSGKTSLLEVIAGLRAPTKGSVALMGRVVDGVPPRGRRVGYVPQDDALFPHLSVRGNVFYARRAAALMPQSRVIEVLEIRHLLDRGVRQLSGGERKRVALARALLSEPEVLLLDEPLAGIDHELRARVLAYLQRVRDEFPIPMVYVTHHADEAAALCEEMVVLESAHADNARVVRARGPLVLA